MDEIDIVQRISETESRSKSNSKRLDEHEKRINNTERLVETVSVLANDLKHTQADVGEIKADVKTLTEKPGKRWDSVVTQIIMLLIGGVIGYFLMKLGL